MQGVCYFAEGRYVRMALDSLQSVRNYIPNMSAMLFTTRATKPPSAFGRVHRFEMSDELYVDKARCLATCPFDYNLYLDADTLMCNPPRGLFNLLDRFDICLAHAPSRHSTPKGWAADVPQAFPEYHAGVILYRKSERIEKFFDLWLSLFEDFITKYPGHTIARGHSDQVPLRVALYRSPDLHVGTLIPEYACRPYGGFLQQKMVILHARNNLRELATLYNKDRGDRVHLGRRVMTP